jgi:hypothetical protein
VTIHSYRTTSSASKSRPPSSNNHYITDKHAMLNDIARNAVIDDEIVEPKEFNIEIDTMGNVIVKEHELAEDGMAITDNQKRIIRVPQEEAYQRIVEATKKKVRLLEHLYEESQKEANRWFMRSFLSATVEAILITFSIFIPFLLHNLNFYHQLMPFTALIVFTNMLNVLITIWIFRQTRVANEQVDLYLYNLTEIRNFATITRFISHLNIDDVQKHLLQKTLVSRSLGLSAQHIPAPTEPHHSQFKQQE